MFTFLSKMQSICGTEILKFGNETTRMNVTDFCILPKTAMLELFSGFYKLSYPNSWSFFFIYTHVGTRAKLNTAFL